LASILVPLTSRRARSRQFRIADTGAGNWVENFWSQTGQSAAGKVGMALAGALIPSTNAD